MSKNHKKIPKVVPPLTMGQKVRVWAFLGKGVLVLLPWYIKLAFVVIPVAAWFAYPYYERWSVLQEEFETQVFNVSGEDLGVTGSYPPNLHSVQFSAGGARMNASASQGPGFTVKRDITLRWSFITKDQGRTDIDTVSETTCYFKLLSLPERLPGQNNLLIGVYGFNTLRLRWSDIRFLRTKLDRGEFKAEDAWLHGHIPLPVNVAEKEPVTFHLVPPRWNEAVDGPTIDQKGNGAWLTLKADYSKPCEEEK